MEILGIGPLELALILIIALIVLGPNDMVKAGRTIGRVLRNIVTSPTWRTVQQTSRELRYLPNKLMREAGLEELKESLPEKQEIRQKLGIDELEDDMTKWQKDMSDWTTPPPTIETPSTPLVASDNHSDIEEEQEEIPQESPQESSQD